MLISSLVITPSIAAWHRVKALPEQTLLDPALHIAARWGSTHKVVQMRLLGSSWEFLFCVKIASTQVYFLYALRQMCHVTEVLKYRTAMILTAYGKK